MSSPSAGPMAADQGPSTDHEPRLQAPAAALPFRVRWPLCISFVVIHLLALLALVPWLFSWTGVVLCVLGLYVFGTLGINLCFHRLLTHTGFVVPKWLERSFAILGVCCLQEGPARWVAVHRMHHQHSDHREDPHSPLVNFFWGHMGWLMVENRTTDSLPMFDRYAPDLIRDPFYLWFELKMRWIVVYMLHALLFFLVGFGIGWGTSGQAMEGLRFGLSLLVWGVILRTVLVWHITWSVNSITHIWGYRNYETRENSRNNWFVGLVSNGEGWHNNHHAEPRAAAHGHRWWEFDLTWITIWALEKVGLAKNVVRPKAYKPAS